MAQKIFLTSFKSPASLDPSFGKEKGRPMIPGKSADSLPVSVNVHVNVNDLGRERVRGRG